MTAKVALQLNAVVGLASTLAAAAMMSLFLTRPETALSALARGEYGALALALLSQVTGWVHALLRFV
jgi:hypothetical protein